MQLIVLTAILTLVALASIVGLGVDSRDGGRWYPALRDGEGRR
jgi:hypothetical protein